MDKRRFNGDDYVDMALYKNQLIELDDILDFVVSHENVYLFGEGKCGKGLFEYLKECNMHSQLQFLTSDTLKTFLNRYRPGRDGIILSLKSDYYSEVLPNMWGKLDVTDVLFLNERSKDIFINWSSMEYLKNHFWISLPLARHCNMNCAACSMYAPLCDCEFYTLENVKKDLSKIKEINLFFTYVNITGGEPFLNPEILDILEFIREIYPLTRINVYTNGLPLMKYTGIQFDRLKKCDVDLQITEYEPTKGKLSYVYDMLDKSQISYTIDYFEKTKKFFKKPIDLENEVPITEYINCQYYTYCFSVFVFKGYIYKCATALASDAINKASGGKMVVTEKDYLDLAKISSSTQVYDFWKSRLPMCRYCPRVTESFTWKKSEKKIEEWM